MGVPSYAPPLVGASEGDKCGGECALLTLTDHGIDFEEVTHPWQRQKQWISEESPNDSAISPKSYLSSPIETW